jgi:hypothetical protein
MKEIQIRVSLLVLFVTLAALVVGVGTAAAADVGIKARAAFEARAWESDFLRHNHGANPAVAGKASLAFEPGARDIEFSRHNCGTHLCAAKVQAGQSTQTQDDGGGIEYRQNKR